MSNLAQGGGRKALMLALALGLAAALLSWNYVQRAGQRARQASLVPVLVAATDIPVRAEVAPQMLAVKHVVADARHPKALTSIEQAAGKTATLPISAGEQVLESKFVVRKEDSGLAFRVPQGKRAVSVSVTEVVAASGLIVPGDFVDVLVSLSGPQLVGDVAGLDSATVTVLQDLQVLAVAQELQGAAPPAQSNGFGGAKPAEAPKGQEAVARPNARTVTLAVDPDQAQTLILAEEKGRIRLALRAVEDHQQVSVDPTLLRDLKP
ncbi:MAG: Flp pilus assembly protein CpaB [Chloroflexota bacterium]